MADRGPASTPALWDNPKLVFPERLDIGYTLVLPGAWGDEGWVEHGIVVGLKNANVASAVEYHDWTAGVLRLVYNLRALDRNKIEARRIADKIVAYQDRYPGRPVHLIGYCGGAGMAVLVLEALPPDRKVASAVLLAPTLAPDYDLRPAMSHTEWGIHNFYSPLDTLVLMALGAAIGTTDGRHSPPAGVVGFQAPRTLDPAEREAYEARLPQRSYQFGMLLDGHAGGHFGWVNPLFVAHHVAPLVDSRPDMPLETAGRRADRAVR